MISYYNHNHGRFSLGEDEDYGRYTPNLCKLAQIWKNAKMLKKLSE